MAISTRSCGGEVCTAQPYQHVVEWVIVACTTIVIIIILVLLGWMFNVLSPKKMFGHFNSAPRPGSKEERINRASFKLKEGFTFCCFYSTGAIILLASIYAWPLNDNDFTCTTKPVLLALGPGMMFGVLFARIYKAWFHFIHRPKLSLAAIIRVKQSKLARIDFFLVFTGVFLIEVVLLTVFYVVDMFRPECECRSFAEEVDGEFSTCTISTYFAITVTVVNAIPVLLSVYFATATIRGFKKGGNVLYGVPIEEISDFVPVMICLGISFGFFVIGSIFSVFTDLLSESQGNRRLYYVLRSFGIMVSGYIPVMLLCVNRYTRYQVKRDTIEAARRIAESKGNRNDRNNIKSARPRPCPRPRPDPATESTSIHMQNDLGSTSNNNNNNSKHENENDTHNIFAKQQSPADNKTIDIREARGLDTSADIDCAPERDNGIDGSMDFMAIENNDNETEQTSLISGAQENEQGQGVNIEAGGASENTSGSIVSETYPHSSQENADTEYSASSNTKESLQQKGQIYNSNDTTSSPIPSPVENSGNDTRTPDSNVTKRAVNILLGYPSQKSFSAR
mmetsp:Transcript_25238/g.30807  ORF Transcript_25238/g.30807 Transcript_25238/m.30807 type:complete len:566 (-) Transcript_25238:671-2368(-)